MYALKKVTPPVLPITPEDSKAIQAHQREVIAALVGLKMEAAESKTIIGKMLDVVNGSLVPVK